MLALAKPYQLKQLMVTGVSNHRTAAFIIALTLQDHRIQRMHRFSSSDLTKTMKERLLDATVSLVAIIASMTKLPFFSEVQRLRKNKQNLLTSSHCLGVLANVDVANYDYKNVVENTFWAQIAVILMMFVWNDVT